jgi:uracil-DNA glycosylase
MTPDSATRPAWPQLDERQVAMLAEMGIQAWWQPARTPEAGAPVSTPRPVTPLPATRAVEPPPAPRRAPERPSTEAQPQPARHIPITPLPADLAQMDRPTLEAAIAACQRCDLGQRRQRAVPGMGDPAPDWLIVGEAPGEEEDRQGLPFVGRAGQLLDRMLAAMQLSREHKVYIANVIKCRPPHNRNPDPVEIEQCTPWLLRQVELLQPKMILAMGRFAAQTVLAQGGRLPADTLRHMPLGRLRGQVHEVTLAGRTLPVVVTYHPAYLLRSPAEKGKTWADLCLAMDTMDRLQS